MGGTSESSVIAGAMAEVGFSVLVSMATEVPFSIPERRLIEIRRGRLNLEQLVLLIQEREVTAIVDSMHPYATEAHATAKEAARKTAVPYLRYVREQSDLSCHAHVRIAGDHGEAARMAAALGRPIMLTIGSRNLAPYVHAAREGKVPICARVLPCRESQESCHEVALSDDEVIQARGPFSVQDTLDLLHARKIGTLVTKESGSAGGVPEKLEAATIAGCDVVVVKSAQVEEADSYRTIEDLMRKLLLVNR